MDTIMLITCWTDYDKPVKRGVVWAASKKEKDNAVATWNEGGDCRYCTVATVGKELPRI